MMKPRSRSQKDAYNLKKREKNAKMTMEERMIKAKKHAIYYQNNKIILNAKNRQYSKTYRNRRKELNRHYRENHREHLKEYNRNRYLNMSVSQKITKKVRQRLYNFLKQKSFKKEAPTIEYLGCTWQEFEQYWKGKINAWNVIHPQNTISIETAEIDHIRPISLFDVDALYWGNHFTNMQPLPSSVNQIKNAKWDDIDDKFWFEHIIFNPTYIAPYLPIQMR